LDPYTGGAGALIEACRNVAAVGAEPIGMVDCLNFGNPENPEVFWTFAETVRGISDAARALNVPCVGGNVSFYNEDSTTKVAVKPSPSLTVVGLIEDASKAISIPFKSINENIILLGTTFPELGGSEYLEFIFDLEGGLVPQVDFQREMNLIKAIQEIISNQYITASHDCSKGGLAIACIKMSLISDFSAELDFSQIQEDLRDDFLLFSETHSRIVITAKDDICDKIKLICEKHKVPFHIIGKTTKSDTIHIKLKNQEIILDRLKMKQLFEDTIPKLMGVE